MKPKSITKEEIVTVHTHTGMAVAHYLGTMRKVLTVKKLAVKMNHPDTGLIYRRLKQAEPDFEFMVNVMEAFGNKDLIEYVPAYAKEMLLHHTKIKHPEWFKENKRYKSNETQTIANEPQGVYLPENDLEKENELLKTELSWMRKLNETQKELIDMLKQEKANTNARK
jgi:hypothetical protein